MTASLTPPRRLLCLLGIPFVLSQTCAAALADAKGKGTSLAPKIPGGALAFIETAGLADIIGNVRGSDLLKGVLESEDFALARQKKWFKEIESSKKTAEFVLQMSLWEASTRLLGGRMGFALYPPNDGGDPEVALLLRPSEPSDWLKKRVWSAPIIRLGLKRIERLAFGGEVAAYRTRGFKNKATYFALHNDWVAVASNIDLLKKTVVLQRPERTRLGKPGPNLGDETAYQRMTKRMGAAHFGRAFIDTQRVAKATGPNLGLPKDANDPMVALFFGGVVELIDNSRFVGFVLDMDGKQVRFASGIDARPQDVAEQYRIFFSDNPSTGMAPMPEVNGHIGGFTLYRQFGSWYRNRDEVLKDSIIPGIEGFQGNIGDILLGEGGGKDGSRMIGDKIAFVSAMRDDAGAEELTGAALPGFAFVVDLEKTDDADATITAIFDAVLGELRGADKKKLKWERSRELHLGVDVQFAKGKSGGRSLVPAVARVGDQLIVSSSKKLTHDLIKVLQKSDRGLVKGKDLIFNLHSAPLQNLLTTNRKQYHTQLVKDGRSPKQAVDDLKNIENLIKMFSSVQGSTSASSGIFEMEVRGRLK